MSLKRLVLSRVTLCTFLLSAAQLAAASTPVVSHDSNSDVPRAVVVYRPMELASDTGALRLLNKIQSSARAVCREYWIDSAIIQSPAWFGCVHMAIARAVDSVQSARLTKLWAQRYPNESVAAELAATQNAAHNAARQP